jgi:hypothetical protein
MYGLYLSEPVKLVPHFQSLEKKCISAVAHVK